VSVPSRATDVAGIRERNSRLISREGRAHGLAFRPRASDVFVSTYPKCGTTLLQQIVHGLRTGGDMDFEEITEVIPWIELAHDMGLDPEAEQKAHPRAYKTHLGWPDVPKGGRYLYAIREPLEVLTSFYHFLEGWFFESGSIDLETFALDYLLAGSGSGRYWEHLVSWWPQRSDENSLFVCYEDLVDDLPGSVAQIAAFIGVAADEDRLVIATRQAHIEFMSAHPTKWDDNLLRKARNRACGLPEDAGSTKVRSQADKKNAEITPAIRDAWDQNWSEIVAPATGLRSYAELRATIAGSGRDS
jgi:hypothetical protein